MELLTIREVIPPGERVVVALSGGRDSVALLHALVKSGAYDLVLAHINHGLRETAWRDQIFVTKLACELGLDLEILETDVKAYAAQHKLSLEEAGREVRYRYLVKVARKHNSQYVITAHTKDDQAETVLGNWLRGCFLDGLGGMEELALLAAADERREPIFLYRPFLTVARETIDGYIQYHRLKYVEDESNRDLRFRRNYLRHVILPQWQKLNPQIKHHLAANAERYRDLDDYLVQQAQNWLDKEGEEYSLLTFNQEHIALRREILRQLLCRLLGSTARINAARIQAGVDWLIKGTTGSSFPLNRQYRLAIEYGTLKIRAVVGSKRLSPPAPQRVELNLNGATKVGGQELVIRKHPRRELALPKDKRRSQLQAFVDGTKLRGKKLYLRFWRPGDRFRPLGMVGKKKLQDFFVDLKVGRRERSHIPLIVTEEDEIVWVVGYRLDDRFKLAAKSKEVWEISWQNS